MNVYNQEKTQILTEYDLTKGYLKDDTITIHYDEVQAVQEEGHYITIREYPNGGKDVEWVIDVEGVEYQPARDVEEPIKVYIPYDERYFKRMRINVLKSLLMESDYRAIKYAEGLYTEDEYAPYKAERQAYREEINQLELELSENETNI